jgi:L-threonylcarbamoyladenylate synthase
MDLEIVIVPLDSEEATTRAATAVQTGGVIAFRTDTFYGLGADPFNRDAVQAIRKLKGREETNPILLLVSDYAQIDRFISARLKIFDDVAAAFWPGPITLIGAAAAGLPLELTAGTGTIGVRLPDDTRVRDFVRICGGALTATSANPSGVAPATTAAQVQSYFPNGLAEIVDGGETTAIQPSTVLDLSRSKPRLVREGAISRKELEKMMSFEL